MFSQKSFGIITISILLSACSVTKSLYKDNQVSRYNPNASTADKEYSNPVETEQDQQALQSELKRSELLHEEEGLHYSMSHCPNMNSARPKAPTSGFP